MSITHIMTSRLHISKILKYILLLQIMQKPGTYYKHSAVCHNNGHYQQRQVVSICIPFAKYWTLPIK